MFDLSVEFEGLRFKNPIIAASGPITSTPYTLNSCIEHGAGAVTVKSVCLDDETQLLPRPGIYFLDRLGERGGLMHRWAGLLPQKQAVEYITSVKKNSVENDVRLIGSFFYIGRWTGLPPFEQNPVSSEILLRKMALEMQDSGAEAIEVVCTCGLSLDPCKTVAFIEEAIPAVFRALKGYLRIPFWLKLGFGHDFFWQKDMATIHALGGKSLHVYSDFRITYLDIEKSRPVLPVSFGYGRWLKGLMNRAVSLSTKHTDFQVISSGGIWSWRDAVERMMCGASLVAVESAVQHRGYKIFEEITDGMIRFMERQGYKTPLEITGLANPHIEDMETFMSDFMMATVPAQSIGIHIDREKCNKCGICASCIYGAMTIINGHPEINPELCERCGACMTICPKEAIFTTAA